MECNMPKGTEQNQDYIPAGKQKKPETLSPVDKGKDYVKPGEKA